MDGPVIVDRARKQAMTELVPTDAELRKHLPLRVGNEVARTPQEVVYVLTRYLAGQCDGAMTPDGHGFNKLDARLGHKLAEQPFEAWTPRQLWAARQMLSRYKNTQLKEWWRAVPVIAEPARDVKRETSYAEYKRASDPNWTPEPTHRRLSLDTVNGQTVIVLKHSYDATLVNAIKSDLPQKRWDKDNKRWYLPLHLDTLERSIDFALEWGYEIPADVHAKCDEVLQSYATRLELSHAASADYEIPGLGGTLFPFQRAGVQYAAQVGNVLIADEMGLGKTPQSLAALKLANQFPALVICPASLKRNWEREARKWIPGCKTIVLTGHVHEITHFDGTSAYDVIIINYNSKVLSKWLDRLIALRPRAIICDEAHNCKNSKAQQTKLVEHLIKETGARRIFLSGTPVVNRPMEFWQLVKMLGYDRALGGYAEYKRRYDNADQRRLQELNSRVRTMFFIRRLKKDVLPELPAKLAVSVPLEITNRKQYTEAEADIAGYFAERKADDARFMAELTANATATARQLGIDAQELIDQGRKQRYTAAYEIAAQNARLLRWEGLKQLAVEGKMASLCSWIEDFMDSSDQKLVLFALHTDKIEYLTNKYRAKYGAVMIHGGVDPDKRMPIVDKFQTDPACRLIVCNMIAAGEGLTLTAASNVAFFEFGWNPKTMSQAEDRCHRIGQKDSVTVYSLVAENTIDEEIVALIDAKRQIVEAIQDGAGADNQRQFMQELEERMEMRRRGVRVQPATLIDDDMPSELDQEIDHRHDTLASLLAL